MKSLKVLSVAFKQEQICTLSKATTELFINTSAYDSILVKVITAFFVKVRSRSQSIRINRTGNNNKNFMFICFVL